MAKAGVVKKPIVEKTVANDDKKFMKGLHPLFRLVASLSGAGKVSVTHESFALTDVCRIWLISVEHRWDRVPNSKVDLSRMSLLSLNLINFKDSS